MGQVKRFNSCKVHTTTHSVLVDKSNDQSSAIALPCKEAFVNTQVPQPTAEGFELKPQC